MLRERDSWTHVSRGQSQKSRTRRQLLLCTMLPAVLLASFFISAIFTVGHLGQRARAAMLRREHAMAKLIDNERNRGGVVYRSPVNLVQNSARTVSSDNDTAAGAAGTAADTPPVQVPAPVPGAVSSSSSSQPAAEQLQRRHREERAERLEQQQDELRGQRQPAQAQMQQQRRRDPAAASERKTSVAAVLSPG